MSMREMVLRPREYTHALRNPLMGFRTGLGHEHEWATLAKHDIRWNEIESRAEDGIDRITAFCDRKWARVEERNVKVVPRVYLEWPNRGRFWPADLTDGDYTSERFQRRVARLIEKLGQAWDNDPRVAFIEMGLIGRWGEHHHPELSAEMQRLLGEAFTRAFRSKLVENRYPWHFEDFRFGLYWDSFGHPKEIERHTRALESPRLAHRWTTAPRGGKMAFDWGTPLGKDPTDAVVTQADTIIALIRRLHWNHLGWVSDYDRTAPGAAANAERIQKAFGYRFVIDEARYPSRVEPGKPLTVSLVVRNTGSTPLYYRWPLEISLLDPATRQPVWRAAFPEVDVRRWLPSFSGDASGGPERVRGTFALPPNLPRRVYYLALALLDPAGDLPAARFAIVNYYQGGRHPLGRIGVGRDSDAPALTGFDDPGADTTLRYARQKGRR